jgi:hypothetical protein
VLQQLHDELDAAVLEAYGWQDLKGSAGVPPASSSSPSGQDARAPFEDELLTRLVALNHARAAEEQQWLIRWLRPDYQNCGGDHRSPTSPLEEQPDLAGTDTPPAEIHGGPGRSALPAWPDRLPDQVSLIRKLIGAHDKSVVAPYDADALSALFGRKNKKRAEQIEGILETLKGLGQL